MRRTSFFIFVFVLCFIFLQTDQNLKQKTIQPGLETDVIQGEYITIITITPFLNSNEEIVDTVSESLTSINPIEQSENGEYALVVKVIDGDTVELDTGQIVRYIGIDTPEIKSSDCYSSDAKMANAELVLGRRVRLEKDTSETDRYGRLLRYVWVDGAMVNELLVQNGYAKAYTYPPDVAYAVLFVEREREARQSTVGLWGACYGKSAEPVLNGECAIKGNISASTGEKIYHTPQDKYYAETVINDDKGERWFCSEDEAIAAGWRRARQ